LALMAFLTLNIAQASNKKEKIELIKCLRKTIDSRRIDQHAMDKTFALLASYNQHNANELTIECKNNLQEIKKLPKSSFHHMLELLEKSLQSDSNRQVYHILHTLIENPTSCKAKGVEVDAAIGVGFGVGLSLGKCYGGNGRNWRIVAPSYSVNFGVGITAMIIKLEFYITRGHIAAESDELIYTAAFMAGARGNFYAEVRAVGVGFAIMIGGTQSYVLRLIPAEQNFNHLLTDMNSI